MDIQTNSKIDFSSHCVTVAWRQSLMKRHENTRLGISDIIGPIESKLDMYDNSPSLCCRRFLVKNTQRLNRSARESVYFHICIPAYNVRQTNANVNTVGECFLLDVECSSSCVCVCALILT